MKILADIKRSIRPGDTLEVTNHYITRPDHPCFGTRTVTVSKVTGSSFYLDGDRIPWPPARQVVVDDAGRIVLYGLGASQKPHELFLTITILGE